MQNAAHGSKTHENLVSVGNKSLKSMFGIIWVRALRSGSGLGLWARDLSLGLLILGSGVRLWAVALEAEDVRVQPRRGTELSKHKQGKNPYN